MRRFFRRLWSFVHPDSAEGELARELSAHLALLQDEYERRGMSRDEASRAARVALGGVEQVKELHRDARSFVWLTDARRDIAHAMRLLHRSPLFALTATLSLAIGIGANTAVFTVANALLLRAPEGVAEPGSIVDIGMRRGDGGLNPMPHSTYLEIGRRSTTLSGLFAQQMFPRAMSLDASAGSSAEPVFGQHVTTGFFTVLGAKPSVGRLFDAGDGDVGSSPAVIVLSHGFWGRRFNQDPNVIGQRIRINGRPFVLVGVAAPGFQGTGIMSPDLWLPLSVDDATGSVLAGARLRTGLSVAQAAAELAAIAVSTDQERGSQRRQQQLHLVPSSRAGGNHVIFLGLTVALLAIASLVLAVACANVAAIILARSIARSKEMALRAALGAGRSRLVRQLLTETVILFSLGAVMGLALARATILLVPLLPTLPIPVSVPLELDVRVILFTTLLSLSAALASGLAPAFSGANTEPSTALKEESPSARGSRLRGALVVGQVALSVLLIVLAGLFVRALRHAGSTDPGFDPHGVAIASLDSSMGDYTDATRQQFWRDVVETVRQLPEVEAATLARVPPGGFEGIGLGSVAAAGTIWHGELLVPSWNIVDTGYFATLRIPLVAGRDFSDRDNAGAPSVAIVGEGISDRFWPEKTAVGESLRVTVIGPKGTSTTRDLLIVGVAGDVKSTSLVDGLAGSYVYLPLQQSDMPQMTTQMTIVARGRHNQRINSALGAAVRKLNPQLAIVRSGTVEDSVALGLAPQRLFMTLTGSLGLVGVLLAAVGIYGVTAYSVARRRREFGIRLALGASRRGLAQMVLRQGLVLTMLGAIIGLTLAAGASQVLSMFLYGLPALHMPTFLATAVAFIIVGLMACYMPARRAMRIDPVRSLRYE